MSDDRELGLEPVDETQDLPRVVEEAHEVLQSYGWQIREMEAEREVERLLSHAEQE